MAKKITDNTPIQNFEDDWGGTYSSGVNAGKEWGKTRGEVERVIKAKVSSMETAIDGKVGGVVVNNSELTKDANGKVHFNVPAVDDQLNASSANTVQNSVVTAELNAIKSNMPYSKQLGETSPDGSLVMLETYNEAGDHIEHLDVYIPAAQEIGEVIQPVVTTELLIPSSIKLGDPISFRWGYSCLRKSEGSSETYTDGIAQTVVVTVKIGSTVVWTRTYAQVAVGTLETVTLGADTINQAGTVSIGVVATTQIDEETKISRGSKTVTVITMDLNTTADPASQLALSNGYTDAAGQIAIPYTYTVPTGTTLKVWVDGVLDSTSTISGTGRNYIYLTAANLSAGRHNIQMIAESAGLLSNAVSVDLLKAGGTTPYIGLRFRTDVEQSSDMPLAYAYGSTPLPLAVSQFEEISLDLAAWSNDALTSTIVIAVDGVVTQTLTADRTLQTISQRFDTAGSHTMTITNGTSVRTFGVTVTAAAGVTEQETPNYVTKLTANGRSNTEENPANWGGITTFQGVDWRTNGWRRGTDGVDALLLTNGAKAVIDIKPFIRDAQTGYSIPGDGLGHNGGMALEMEVMISQVMERGATVMSCLCDNDGNGYPVGIKVTTETAGMYFGGVEEITTAEDLVDSEGNYIDYEGNIVDSNHKVPLKVTRPHCVERNIALDEWIHLMFIAQPVTNNYGLAMLFINGKLSRANRYSIEKTLIQNTPVGLTFDSDKADIRIRRVLYYRGDTNNSGDLTADESLSNFIISRPTALEIQTAHNVNNVGTAFNRPELPNETDNDGNIVISIDALHAKGRGTLTIIRSADSGNGLDDLFTCVDKKQDFRVDYIRWDPPLDGDGNPIGEGFEAWNVYIRIQGTSSVKYPYKNIRIYLTKGSFSIEFPVKIVCGGVTYEQQYDSAKDKWKLVSSGGKEFKGYALRGSSQSIEQAVLCAKTDFVDSSLAGNTGGAHLFNSVMSSLGLLTPPQEYDARVRQSIDGLPCDIFCGKSTSGTLTYCGQFVLNNEKSKSTKIFGMEGVKDANSNTVDFRAYENQGTEENPNMVLVGPDTQPFALEALDNNSPMTLFHPAGSANSQALADQLAAKFDDGFEFNAPEDAKWATIGTGDYAAWGGAQASIKRWMGWIYDCVPSAMRSNPDYGTAAGWSAASKAKWVSSKFKNEASQYFNMNHLLTYYLVIDYLAGKDQLAKNIIWRTWDGLLFWAGFYDGDTWEAIRNDAFIVYLYSITRDSYDFERSKFAFEGHSSWLWCLVLANFEEELKQRAAALRQVLTNQAMLDEFIGTMIGNWSARQFNKSGKLKYIDTIERMNYVYTLTGSREEHIRQFLTDRARLRDARYGAGSYNDDEIILHLVRNDAEAEASSLDITSGDLYYFGYTVNSTWRQSPTMAGAGEQVTLEFDGIFSGVSDPVHIKGASCIKELDLTDLGSDLNGQVNLSKCVMLTKLTMPATKGVANAPITLGNISKLEYVELTGQTSVHTGTAGVLDFSKHTRLQTFLAGGTSATSVMLPEGAPVSVLTLPATLTTLTLRYLPNLKPSGLTLSGTSNITSMSFAECPNLSWQTILAACPNVRGVRIEGMSGRVHSSILTAFMEGYSAGAADPTANMVYHGLTAAGTTTPYPALIGKVSLIDDVDDFETMRSFFALCGLELLPPVYSEYVFHDEETDPANISNMGNGTGYAFREQGVTYTDAHPNGYYPSGNIVRVREKSQLCYGVINSQTGKMHVTKLDRTDLTKTAAGETFNPGDGSGGGDVFMYLPHYWYKGVNNFKNATKHFFLSANDECPQPSGTTHRYPLSGLVFATGYGVRNNLNTVGTEITAAGLAENSQLVTYRVDVEGMKQVRFPAIHHIQYCSVFTDSDNIVTAINNLFRSDVSGNPMDFMNDQGDYDFRDVPEGAKWLYFTTMNTVAQTNVAMTTDSSDLEAIEPDWVEHLPELIGVYQGTVNGMTTGGTPSDLGLRSLSGRTACRGNDTQTTYASWQYDADGNAIGDMPMASLNGTAQDFYNLASIRGAGYSTVPYETSKDMANLIMCWFGTRDVETIVGRGSQPAYTTGARNNIALGDTQYIKQNQINKMWGLEAWTATVYEWTDKGCLNAPSFDAFKKAKRIAQNAWVVDYYYNILQQNGVERRVKAQSNNQGTNVARVRFGRYCDIVVSSFAGDTAYAKCYAAGQWVNNGKGRVLGRSFYNARADAGVASSYTGNASSSSYAYLGGRLCFFGEIENEEDVL